MGPRQPECAPDLNWQFGELTGSIPIKYVNLRGNIRLGFSKKKVRQPDGSYTWSVTVFGWGEGAVGNPGSPVNQINGGVNGTFSQTYTGIKSEQEANEFPERYVKYRLGQAANTRVKSIPGAGGLLGLAKRAPGIGGVVKRFTEPEPLPGKQDNWRAEIGNTGSITGGGSLGPFSGWVGTRGWSLAGITKYSDGRTAISMRNTGWVMAAGTGDIGEIVEKLRSSGAVRSAAQRIPALEKVLSTKSGRSIKLPPEVQKYINSNWEGLGTQVGLSVLAYGSLEYSYVLDKNGRPIELTKSVDTQVNAQARILIGRKGQAGGASLHHDIPFYGNRSVQQSSLDLRDPENLRAATKFFAGTALARPVLPPGAALQGAENFAGDGMDHRFRTRGTVTKQNYSSRWDDQIAGAYSKSGYLASYEKLNQTDKLKSAYIWKNGKKVKWDQCRR